jgi:ubiquinone/menaquinone biosynthesis C-methylase UbiE
MLEVIQKTTRHVLEDIGLTCGLLGENRSRGSARDIAHFYDSAEKLYATARPRLWAHERYILETYLPPPPATVLDIGCGGGRTTSHLAQNGYRVTGIDLSKNLLHSAKQAAPQVAFLAMDAGHLGLPEAAFDAVIFSHNGLDCVVPVQRRLQVLREMYRVVRPGGRCYLSSHNIWGKVMPERRDIYGWTRWGYDWSHRLLRQCTNASLWHGYWWYYDEDGWQLLYSASPKRNVRLFAQCGWSVVAVLGRGVDTTAADPSAPANPPASDRLRRRLSWLTFNEHHVQYVLEKPS